MAPDVQVVRLNRVPQMLGVSRSTLYRMIRRGEVPAVIKISKWTRGMLLADLTAWLASRKKELN